VKTGVADEEQCPSTTGVDTQKKEFEFSILPGKLAVEKHVIFIFSEKC
jgi:hypothetical protein